MRDRILVTGAGGYLASWIVENLLREGHSVHATVRRLGDGKKTKHLHDLAMTFPGMLSLYEADLLVERSFDKAMAGCDAVIHTASPYLLDKPKDVDVELIKPAVSGTLNVLGSVNRTETVRRVVLTSSVATLYNDACDVGAEVGHTVQESDVNPNQDLNHNPYAYSKTLAEKAAWDEQKKQTRWDLITIHPGAMFGPSLSRRVDATSVGMVIQFLNGSFRTGVPKLWLGVVDVRDVAEAHVRAATLPVARKRYIIVANSSNLLEISKMMRVDDHGIKNKLPKGETLKALIWLIGPLVGMRRTYVSRNVNHPVKFNSERSKKELGICYRKPEQTFDDHLRQIVADGLLAT